MLVIEMKKSTHDEPAAELARCWPSSRFPRASQAAAEANCAGNNASCPTGIHCWSPPAPPLPPTPTLPRHTHSVIFSLNPSQSHYIVPLEFQRDARITVSTLGEAWHCQPMSTISDAFTSVFKVTLSDAI